MLIFAFIEDMMEKTWDETESPESYISNQDNLISLKGGLSGLRPCLTTETPLKMMKNVFYFTLKALFVFALTFSPCRKTTSLEKSG